MEQSAPGVRIGTFGLTGLPLVLFPLPSQAKFLKFRTKGQTRVTPLYTGGVERKLCLRKVQQ